jgi:hypothetical protein
MLMLMMLSVPHNGQAMVTRPVVVLEATTGVFIAGPAFLRPSELPPSAVPNPVRYMPRWYTDFRHVTLVPIWAIDTSHQVDSVVFVAAR